MVLAEVFYFMSKNLAGESDVRKVPNLEKRLEIIRSQIKDLPHHLMCSVIDLALHPIQVSLYYREHKQD